MYRSRSSIADFMQGSKTLIENALTDASIASILAGFGYDAARIEAGRRLWTEADSLARKQSADKAEQRGAAQDLDRIWEAANAAYMKSLKVARVAFGEDNRAITSLKLYGSRKQSLAGWLEQASTFYGNVIASAEFLSVLGRYGYSRSKLLEEGALVEEVRKRSLAHAEGNGAAQSATAQRDAKLRELDAWVSDFRCICRVALYEQPQELEKLGVMVLNGPRREAASKAAAKAASA